MSTVVLYSFLLVLLLLVLLWLSGYVVKWVLSSAISEVPKPEGISPETWNALTAPLGSRSGAWLGFLERVLSLLAFSQGAYALLAGWLVLKLGSKWQTWASVAMMPETYADLSAERWLVDRRLLAALLSQRFLIGTLSNLLLGWAIFLVAKVTTEFLQNWP